MSAPRLAVVLLCVLVAPCGCGSAQTGPAPGRSDLSAENTGHGAVKGTQLGAAADALGSSPTPPAWAGQTAAPRALPQAALSLEGCQSYDLAATRLAELIAARQASGAPPLDLSALTAWLRAFGSPAVWPRTWTLQARALDELDLRGEWARWSTALPRAGERRCGIARAGSPGHGEVLAVVASEALADLRPLPTRARLGQWLTLDARLLVPVASAEVMVAPERGAPRRVPVRLAADALRATFTLDHPGLWRVQVLVETSGGPRPALEAWIFVDVEPSMELALGPAPGEVGARPAAAGADSAVQRQALFEMLDGARAESGLAPLRRDERLDAIAQAHAEAMRASRRTAHDVGAGSLAARLDAAGITAARIGENVALASSVALAHRALYASPSHRGNILDPGHAAVGLGVAVELAQGPGATDGVWVCEVFAAHVRHK